MNLKIIIGLSVFLFGCQILNLIAGANPNRYDKWTSAQVVDAFRDAGLDVGNPRPLTKADYGLAPYVGKEGTRFFIPSLGSDRGGRIISFENAEELARLQKYYVDAGKASAAISSWVYVRDNVLVQINGSLPEDRARRYEDALNNMQ